MTNLMQGPNVETGELRKLRVDPPNVATVNALAATVAAEATEYGYDRGFDEEDGIRPLSMDALRQSAMLMQGTQLGKRQQASKRSAVTHQTRTRVATQKTCWHSQAACHR